MTMAPDDLNLDRQRWARIDPILDGALELPADERAAFVERACEGDTALQRDVERILAAATGQHRLLDAETGALIDAVFESSTPSATEGGQLERIGSYRILEKIGEGGFGEVFCAEQLEPVMRDVAIKIVKPGMDTHEVIARFTAERQALARMDHPNITVVHDAGQTEDGRCYFVMELIRGIPITRYCDEHDSTPNSDSTCSSRSAPPSSTRTPKGSFIVM